MINIIEWIRHEKKMKRLNKYSKYCLNQMEKHANDETPEEFIRWARINLRCLKMKNREVMEFNNHVIK